jgi:hypothetical protein
MGAQYTEWVSVAESVQRESRPKNRAAVGIGCLRRGKYTGALFAAGGRQAGRMRACFIGYFFIGCPSIRF